MYTREELWEIRGRANFLAGPGVSTSEWTKALQDLAYAADRLDAMVARTILSNHQSIDEIGRPMTEDEKKLAK
jgi:hypothetical protein